MKHLKSKHQGCQGCDFRLGRMVESRKLTSEAKVENVNSSSSGIRSSMIEDRSHRQKTVECRGSRQRRRHILEILLIPSEFFVVVFCAIRRGVIEALSFHRRISSFLAPQKKMVNTTRAMVKHQIELGEPQLCLLAWNTMNICYRNPQKGQNNWKPETYILSLPSWKHFYLFWVCYIHIYIHIYKQYIIGLPTGSPVLFTNRNRFLST